MISMGTDSPAYRLRQSARLFKEQARAKDQDAINYHNSAVAAEQAAKRLRAQAAEDEKAAAAYDAVNRNAP